MSTLIEYTHRPNAIKPARSYRLSDDALVWRDAGGVDGALSLADIREVRARYAPTRVQRDRYLLELTDATGRTITIPNSSYRAIGDFERHDAEYVAFARDLHRRLARANPDVVFRSGTTPVGYAMSWVIAGYLLAVVTVAAFFLVAVGMFWIVPVKLAVLVFYAPTLVRHIRSVRPRRYLPDAIPPRALPPPRPSADSLGVATGAADAGR